MSENRKILAVRDRFSCISECECGTIHVAVGAIEVKFTRDSVLELYEMLQQAIFQMTPRSSSSFRDGEVDYTALHSN